MYKYFSVSFYYFLFFSPSLYLSFSFSGFSNHLSLLIFPFSSLYKPFCGNDISKIHPILFFALFLFCFSPSICFFYNLHIILKIFRAYVTHFPDFLTKKKYPVLVFKQKENVLIPNKFSHFFPL